MNERTIGLNDDDLVLLVGYVVLMLVLAALIYKSRDRKRTAIIHLTLLLAYGIPLLYGLNFKSEGGNALAWFVYLLAAIALHVVVAAVQLVAALLRGTRGT